MNVLWMVRIFLFIFIIGFERFANGKLITVFSATDYCGKHKNAGAILYLTKEHMIKPYLIYPQDSGNNWRIDDERPPTPPRNRQNSVNSADDSGTAYSQSTNAFSNRGSFSSFN